MTVAKLKDIQIPWLVGKYKAPPAPADLKLIDSGAVYDNTKESLKYRWFLVEEKENGRIY